MSNAQGDVLIIGAGVCGLVLAQGLKHRGIPFKVFERNESLELKYPGYRFRCEAPGVVALKETVSPQLWDLIEATHAKDSPPVMTMIDPLSLEVKMTKNAVQDLSPEGQICYPIDRRWWREVGCVGIEDHIVFDKAFESYEILDDGVRVTFADKSTATGRLVVAADGVHSRVRRQLLPDFKLVDVDRMVCWGRTPYTEELRSKMPKVAFATHVGTAIDRDTPTNQSLWSAIEWPGDLVKLSGGKLSPQEDYVFWVLSSKAHKELLTRDTTVQDRLAWVEKVTGGWNPALQNMFKMQDPNALSILPIHSVRPDFPDWDSKGRVTFIGDSIHSMSPAGGVGGRTAIMDARDLCMAIEAAEGQDHDAWLKHLAEYERVMKERAVEAVTQAFNNGKWLWAGKDWWEYEPTI